MKEIDKKLFEELCKDDLEDDCEVEECSKSKKVEEEVELDEGTSNFPTRSEFPLLVFYTYDEFLYNMTHHPDYPQEEQFENERDNGDFYIDWDAFEAAKDEFEQKYWDENDICVLDEDEQERLESKLDDFNDETSRIADNLYDANNDDDYYALKDIELKIASGYYEAAYIDIDGEEQFGYMSESLANEQKARFNNFLKELKKEFGLTQLSLAYRASNGETGFNIVKDEALEEGKKPLEKDAKELKSLYNKYVKEWKEDHKGPEYKGMKPACFDEWYDNEYLDSFDKSLEENIYVNDDPVDYDGDYDSEGEYLRIYLDFTGSSKTQAFELLEYLKSKNVHSINTGINLYDDYYRKKIEKVLNKPESEFNRFAISFVFDNDYVSKSKGYMLMFVSYSYATENRPVRFECWCNYEELIQTIERICGSVADESVEQIYNDFFKKKDKNKKSLGDEETNESLKEEKLVEKPIGLDSGEFVPEDEIGIVKQKDSGEFTGVRRTPGKPVEYVAGAKDVDKDSKAIGALSKLNPEQRKKAWNSLMKQESLEESSKEEEKEPIATISLEGDLGISSEDVEDIEDIEDELYAWLFNSDLGLMPNEVKYVLKDKKVLVYEVEPTKYVVSLDVAKRIKTADDLNDFYAYVERFEDLFEYSWPESEQDRIDELMAHINYTPGKFDSENVARIFDKVEESLKEGVEFIDSIELGTRTIGDGPYHDGDGVIYLLKDGDKYYAEYAVENENGPIEDPEYLDDVGEHNSLEELKAALKEHNYFKEELEENKSLDEDDTLGEKKKKKEPFVKVGTGFDLAKDTAMTNHMLGSDCCEDLDSLAGTLDELKVAIANKDSKKEKQLRSALRRLGMDDMTQDALLDEDFDEYDTDSYYDEEDICIYQFPVSFNEVDWKKAKEYGLEYLGKVNDLGYQPGDHLVKGKYKDLKRYCDEYLDYVMHPYYLYKEGDIDLEDILEPANESLDESCSDKELVDKLVAFGTCDNEEEAKERVAKMSQEMKDEMCKSLKRQAQDHLLNDSLNESSEVARVEYCVMDKYNNNIACFDNTDDAIAFAKDNEGIRVLEVQYGPKDEHDDEPELGTEEVWSIRESLDESMKSEVTKWWKDVEDANREMKWEFNIDNGDYSDVEAMHAAMFDMLDDLKEKGASELFDSGKNIYNKYAKFSKYNESLNEALRRYKIEYWIDEDARDQGFGDIAIETFDDLEDAKEYADKLFDDVASVEVLDTQDSNNVVYGRYPEDESVITNDKNIDAIKDEINPSDVIPQEEQDALAKGEVLEEGGLGSGDHRDATQRYNDRLHATFRRYDEMNNKMAQFLLDHGVSQEEIDELKANTGLHGNALHQKLIDLGLDKEFFEKKESCKESISAWSIKANALNEEIEIYVKKNDKWESIASVENCPTKDMLDEDIRKEYSKLVYQVLKENNYSVDKKYGLFLEVKDANSGKVTKEDKPLMTGSKKECDEKRKQLQETSPEDSHHNLNKYIVRELK